MEHSEFSEDGLDLWTEGSEAARSIVSFVESALDPGSDGYIPPADRIAVFDMDGTIVCDSNPGDMEWQLYIHRATADPTYKATPEQIEFAREMSEVALGAPKRPGFNERKNIHAVAAFSGMTLREYTAYVEEFLSRPCALFEGMRMNEAFYRPMIQLIDYLQKRTFKVFICSATERFNVRTSLSRVIDIPSDRILGTSFQIVSTGQGDEGMDHVYSDTEEMAIGTQVQFIAKNMNKVLMIVQEIGKVPVLAFGNSSGDYGMMTYTCGNRSYKARAYLVLPDDDVREHGNPAKAEAMKADAEGRGWSTISMKDDFKTIYGDGVVPRRQ